jgi:hypothetical protein
MGVTLELKISRHRTTSIKSAMRLANIATDCRAFWRCIFGVISA